MKVKTILLSLFFIFLMVGCNSMGDLDGPQPVKSTLNVSGTGIASAIPDVVDIQLGVDTINTDPVEAVSQNTVKMNAVMTVLDKMDIASSEIQTVYYSMWVEDVYDQDYQPTGEKRYHVTNQVNIRLRDLAKIGTLIEQATDAGATTVSGITFRVAETTELEQTALDSAIKNAREKADRIAREMGVSVGEIISVSEGGYYTPPVAYYGDKGGVGGGGAVPISEGQFSMTAQIQIVFELIP